MRWLLFRLGRWLVYRCARDQADNRLYLMLALAGDSMIVMNTHLVLPKGIRPRPVYPDVGGGLVAGNVFESHECDKAEKLEALSLWDLRESLKERAFAEGFVRMQQLMSKAARRTGQHHRQQLWRNVQFATERTDMRWAEIFPFAVDFEAAKAEYAEQLGEPLTFEQERIAMVVAFTRALEEAFGDD